MFKRAPQPRRSGPRYYRLPHLGALIFVFVLVVILMFLLFKTG